MVKKTLLICFVFSIVFIIPTDGWASFSYGRIRSKTVWDGIDLQINDVCCSGLAHAENSNGDWDYDEDLGGAWNVFAEAELSSTVEARAIGETPTPYHLNASAEVAPPAGLRTSAYGEIYCSLLFMANETGNITFYHMYSMSYSLGTENTGDTSYVNMYIDAKLYESDGFNTGTLLGEDSAEYYFNSGGGGGDMPWLSVMSSFSQGDYGVIECHISIEADACTVPAPAAIFLAGLGGGLACWFRKRNII